MRILILIAVTILAVGCVGKNESTTETKPVQEKQKKVTEEVKPEKKQQADPNKAQLFLQEAIKDSFDGKRLVVACRLYGNMTEGFEFQYTWCENGDQRHMEGEVSAHLNLNLNKYNLWSGYVWRNEKSIDGKPIWRGLMESPVSGHRPWYDIGSADEKNTIGMANVPAASLTQAIKESLVDGKLPSDYFIKRDPKSVPKWVKTAHEVTKKSFDDIVDVFKPPLPKSPQR